MIKEEVKVKEEVAAVKKVEEAKAKEADAPLKSIA